MATDRQMIDRMIDWKKTNRPSDVSAIKVNITPEALHIALGRPPHTGGQCPSSVLYRGYRIECSGKPKPPERPPLRRPMATPYVD